MAYVEVSEATQAYIDELVRKARAAQAIYAEFDQAGLNRTARAAARSVYDNAEIFAKEAVEETNMGTVEGKILKQKGAMTSQGKLDVDCVLKIAKPIGVVAAVQPVTNPTTNFGGNAMYALKSGNAIIICPHPRAKNVSNHCGEVMRAAIKAVGAPEDLVQVIENPSIEMTTAAMRSCDVILATGGAAMVDAANSAGRPSFGVGQGNCQVIIDKGMNELFDKMAEGAINNRIWDNGIPCTGEQTIIMPAKDAKDIVASFRKFGAMVLEDEDVIDRLRNVLFEEKNGSYRANPDMVGQTPQTIGKAIGLDVPEEVKSFLVHIHKFGKEELLCKEKMCPVSNYITYDGDWAEAVNIAKANLFFEGAGHSSDIYTFNKEHQVYAGNELPVCRLFVNRDNGGVGGEPYHSLGIPQTTGVGCGFWQHNVLTENLTYAHLLNYTRVYYTVPGKKTETDEEIWAE